MGEIKDFKINTVEAIKSDHVSRHGWPDGGALLDGGTKSEPGAKAAGQRRGSPREDWPVTNRSR